MIESLVEDYALCEYCPDCDELLCKLNSDIKGNFRGWCGSCKLIWLLSGNYSAEPNSLLASSFSLTVSIKCKFSRL